jgi:hypothetical protein
MDINYKQAQEEFEEKAQGYEEALYAIFEVVKEARKGDAEDKQMALSEIELILANNNINMPF